MTLRCYSCKTDKSLPSFTRDTRMKRGYKGSCRECSAVFFKNWYAANKTTTQAKKRIYKQENPAVVNASNAKRRAAKLQRTPKWLTLLHYEQIQMFYTSAAELGKELNLEFDVDHIVPLQGENVSGLHVPWNLQVLLATDNGSKSNKVPA